MIISMIIEAVVLRLNGETAQNLSNLNQYHQNPPKNFSYMNYTYANYLAQYNSIIDGNIWFMVFEAFLTALCVSSNTIEIMSIGIINICLLLFSCIQVFQSFKWIKRINFQIQLDSAEIANFPTSQGQLQQSVVYAELVQLAFLTFFAAASIFFGYKLYGQFGWKIYKKIVFQSVCIAIVIPTLGIGLWGVRSENKPAMFVYATLSIATVVNFLYILATFIIKRDESLLTFL
ncbi:7600_t:CDS:2, partial [Scutellospora calospora]